MASKKPPNALLMWSPARRVRRNVTFKYSWVRFAVTKPKLHKKIITLLRPRFFRSTALKPRKYSWSRFLFFYNSDNDQVSFSVTYVFVVWKTHKCTCRFETYLSFLVFISFLGKNCRFISNIFLWSINLLKKKWIHCFNSLVGCIN